MAQENKGSFVLYFSYRKHLEFLTDAECGQLFKALLDYGETKKEPELEGAARMAFSFIACQMDRDAEKYAETVKKRSEAGKKGGRPKKSDSDEKANKANAFSEKQSEAKKADNEYVYESDYVYEYDNEYVYESDYVYEYDNDSDTTTPYIPQGGNEAPAAAEQTPYKAIVELYHKICKSYPKLKKVSDNRKKAIAARWKEYGHDLDTFRELFEKAEASPFLKGKNKRNWTADFNWLMNSENMAKVLEGNYADKTNGSGRKEMVPSWCKRELDADEIAAIQRMMAEDTPAEEPATVGNDPELADRAEKLKQQLRGE